MGGLRHFLITRPQLAMWLVALALVVKAVMPGGYMVRQQGTVLTIAICGDASATHQIRQIVVPQRESARDAAPDHAKNAACPFSVLAMAGTAGADAILLGQSLAFIVAVGLAPLALPEPAEHPYLRPPLRGPPIVA